MNQDESQWRRAVEADPGSFEGRFLWALGLFHIGKADEALEQARIAVQIDGSRWEARLLLANILAQLGKVAEALGEYEHIVSEQPTPPVSAFQGVVFNKKVSEADRPLIQEMSSMLGRLGEDPMGAAHDLVLQVCLGKAMEDLGYHEAAIHHLRLAQQLSATTHMFWGFNRKETTATVENFRRYFPKDAVNRPGQGVDSELPIFIVGMPRSGSTLLEQILSSHPKIGAVGELDYWRGTWLAQDPTRVFEAGFAIDEALRYRQKLRSLAPGKKRVIDKTLPHYSLLGPLHMMFPNARIIHCRRHPVDTCLSILMNTLLLAQPPEYVYDLADMVFAYRAYENQMDHWRNVIPENRLIEVDYEDLILDSEGQTRQILDFCGLEWDGACLHHERNDRRVETPSKWQVRQPIYTTSVVKWRHYAPWLGPLAELLTPEERANL